MRICPSQSRLKNPKKHNIFLKKHLQSTEYGAILCKVVISLYERVAALSFLELLQGSENCMSKITETVAKLARDVVEAEGCSLWDVEYVREAGSYYLRVYIDKAGGVSINDCVAMNDALDAPLDEADPIPDSYIFEVASAGAERELKRPSDFEAFIGSEVEVRTYRPVNGQKSFIGILKQYQDGDLVISSGDQDTEFKKQDVALVRLHVSF